MRNTLFILFLGILCAQAFGQQYRVYFKDKGENVQMLSNPSQFLSQRSLERRADDGIWVDHSDLPVSRKYLMEVKDAGVEILASSKWLNYALIQGELKEIPSCVSHIEKVKKYQSQLAAVQQEATTFDYGNAEAQIQMLNGNKLHEQGFTGRGMLIAVIDGGFQNAYAIRALDSLWAQNRVVAMYDFVDNDTVVYNSGSHGTHVLSVMAANLPGEMVGAAPHAFYALLKSEDQSSETTAEMDNWVRAAEFADSIGADVINSSLGYNEFDGGVGDLAYSDMDGRTAVSSLAAVMAARKGITVTISAGNEGSGSWQYITSPADADSILAVAAVDGNANHAGFSSRGPSSDGRVKPDVAALGSGTTISYYSGNITTGSGTSYAAPIIAGLNACLMQAVPSASNIKIRETIIQSASQSTAPDDYLGYGIPNYHLAQILSSKEEAISEISIEVYPNPVKEAVTIEIANRDELPKNLTVEVFHMNGKVLLQQALGVTQVTEIATDFSPGVYVLKISGEGVLYKQKIIK